VGGSESTREGLKRNSVVLAFSISDVQVCPLVVATDNDLSDMEISRSQSSSTSVPIVSLPPAFLDLRENLLRPADLRAAAPVSTSNFPQPKPSSPAIYPRRRPMDPKKESNRQTTPSDMKVIESNAACSVSGHLPSNPHRPGDRTRCQVSQAHFWGDVPRICQARRRLGKNSLFTPTSKLGPVKGVLTRNHQLSARTERARPIPSVMSGAVVGGTLRALPIINIKIDGILEVKPITNVNHLLSLCPAPVNRTYRRVFRIRLLHLLQS
jgi:hypothetical protein